MPVERAGCFAAARLFAFASADGNAIGWGDCPYLPSRRAFGG